MAVQAFDLAERLQTPVLVMSDLDLGMNDWLSEPLTWDDSYRPDRGKVLTSQQLEDGFQFFRYLDVDGDAIPYRTLPGTHPSKGAFFTRGSGHDRFGAYTEEGAKYQDNVDRLRRKFDTAATLVPDAILERNPGSSSGVLYFGTSAEVMPEALDALFASGKVDEQALRRTVRAAATLEGEYRLSHLETHRRMHALLTEEQVTRYNHLRGYGSGGGQGHGMKH